MTASLKCVKPFLKFYDEISGRTIIIVVSLICVDINSDQRKRFRAFSSISRKLKVLWLFRKSSETFFRYWNNKRTGFQYLVTKVRSNNSLERIGE